MKKLLVRVGMVALVTLVSLGLVELGLRIFHPISSGAPLGHRPTDQWQEYVHQPSPIEGLAYELAPDRDTTLSGVVIRTNSLGMRDDEPTPQPVRRLVTIGDSFTFGQGGPMEVGFPRVLENMLNNVSPEEAFDVLNLGVIGYSTRDEALVLEHKALAWEPELIVIGYYLNDPEIEPMDPLHRYYVPTQPWQHSHLARLIVKLRRQSDAERLGGGDLYKYLHAPGGRKWQSVLTAFDDMQRVAGEAGIPVLVLVFPKPLVSGWPDYPYRAEHERIVAAATERGFGVVDLLEEYAKRPPSELMVRPGDPHPSALGHRIAATAAFRWMTEREPWKGMRPGAPAR